MLHLLTLNFHPNAGDDEAREPVRQVHCDVVTCTLPCGPAATKQLQPVLYIGTQPCTEALAGQFIASVPCVAIPCVSRANFG